MRARARRAVSADEKIIVEHTNINPNKAAHIGHLRNAILGDTFVRMLRAAGRTVEVQNYIDNTGVQVADVVVGFLHPEIFPHCTAQDRFDYLCWDLYARVSAYYEQHPEALEWRRETLHAIEAGGNATAEKAHEVADTIVAGASGDHVAAEYRVRCAASRERDSAFEVLGDGVRAVERAQGAFTSRPKGKNKGCWVMPGSAFRGAVRRTDEEDSKVIVRSNGTVTYVGKDIAYQLWKFGLLGKDFYYRRGTPIRTAT